MENIEIKIRDRFQLERQEEKMLAQYAVKASQANQTRMFPEADHPYRTAFQRDRDRIIHSRAFRRLKHKQQVFLISEGDHFRTRLTHTLEVSQLSRTIAKALGLNEDLVETIALGHDLGHTPFGHTGEIILHQILSGKENLNGLLLGENYGGFKHNYQSLRIVDKIEKKYEFDGLNLTAFSREGIIKHTKLRRDIICYPDFIDDGINYEYDQATTIEGQIVAICDEIAQRTHDLEDGIRAGYVELEQVRELEIIRLVENNYSLSDLFKKNRYEFRNALLIGLINFLVSDVIDTTLKNIADFFKRKKRYHTFDEEIVKFSEQIDPMQLKLDRFIGKEIISKCSQAIIIEKNVSIIKDLFYIYLSNIDKLPKYLLMRYSDNEKNDRQKMCRAIADNIAGMTDRFAELELIRLKKVSNR